MFGWAARTLHSRRDRFNAAESGATLVEYALVMALIAIGYAVASSMLGNAILWGVMPRP
jgi:Flp pilus assembly pilin Flp